MHSYFVAQQDSFIVSGVELVEPFDGKDCCIVCHCVSYALGGIELSYIFYHSIVVVASEC